MKNLNITPQLDMECTKPIDSVSLYQWFWMPWKILGIDTKANTSFLRFYNLLLNIFVTIAYPLHLIIGLFVNVTISELFKNLSINVTCLTCSMKHLMLRYKQKDIQNMLRIMTELDEHIINTDEKKYFRKVPQWHAEYIAKFFLSTCVIATTSATALTFSGSERRLMYPAWIPFDWKTSSIYYWCAFTYQFIGVNFQIVQNLASDIFAPMSLCVVRGHVHTLGMRISKIGHNKAKTMDENYNELNSCLQDFGKLIQVVKLLQISIFYAQLVQFLASGLIICVTLIYLLFYAENIFAYIYYTVFLGALIVEIFPCCYYGSLLKDELNMLPYTTFTSKWTIQKSEYQKNLIIFTQLTLKEINLLAGGLIGINLKAFFGTCKMAYSMFVAFLSYKKF